MILALEFYSGIGGFHLALQRSNANAKVIRAFDWDPAASEVYTSNFGKGIVQRTDISQLSASDLIPLNAQLWLLSPACQPYTVLNPAAKGASDPRAKSFLHLVENVIPELARTNDHPKWLLVENVVGFETSTTRETLVNTLRSTGYTTAEFLLTPLQFGIPNSRSRYYCLAKRSPLFFMGIPEYASHIVSRSIPDHGPDWVDPRLSSEPEDLAPQSCLPLSAYLDMELQGQEKYAIPDKILQKKAVLYDIVKPNSRRSCCFTRGYTHMIEGTSVLQMNEELDTTETFNTYAAGVAKIEPTDPPQYPLHILHSLRLRYFTPDELLRLFNFNPIASSTDEAPDSPTFRWPAMTSVKTRYRLIGNSVNVKVVTELIKYLFEGDVVEE